MPHSESATSHPIGFDDYDNVLNYLAANTDYRPDEDLLDSPDRMSNQPQAQRLTSSYYDNLNAINFSSSGKPNVVPLYDNLEPSQTSNVPTYDNLENMGLDLNQRNSASSNSLNQLDELNKSIIDQLCYVTDYGSNYEADMFAKAKAAEQADLVKMSLNLRKEVQNAQRQAEKLDKLDEMSITKVVQMNIPSKIPLSSENKVPSVDTDEELANLDESWQTLIKEVKDLSNHDKVGSQSKKQDENDTFFKVDSNLIDQLFVQDLNQGILVIIN